MKIFNQKSGIGLVEVVVGAGILSVAGVTLFLTYGLYVQRASVAPRPIQASFLLDEGMEVMRLTRDQNWNSILGLQVGTNYTPSFNASTSAWSLTTTISPVDNIFYRTIQVANVNRGATSDIVSSGGTLDTNTKKITVSVSWWNDGATTTKQLVGFLTNLF